MLKSRILLVSLAAAAGAVGQAQVVSVYIDNPWPTVNPGQTYTYTGKVTITGSFDSETARLQGMYLDGSNSVGMLPTFAAGLLSYLVALTPGTYTGDLMTLTVDPNQADGDYDHSFNQAQAALLTISASNSVRGTSGNGSASYAATVAPPVPEPAPIGLLGLGFAAVGLKRKLRR